MLKPSHQLRRLGRTILVTVSASLAAGVTVFSSWAAPARAGFPVTGGYIHVTGVQQAPSSVIYGSPIPAPVPLNRVTGSTTSTTYYGVTPGTYTTRGRAVDSTLIYPTVVNSPIYNSTQVNPTVVDSFGYPRAIGVPSYPGVIGVPAYPYPRTIIRGSFGISY